MCEYGSRISTNYSFRGESGNVERETLTTHIHEKLVKHVQWKIEDLQLNLLQIWEIKIEVTFTKN